MQTLAEYFPQLLLAWSIRWMEVLSPGPGVVLIMAIAAAGTLSVFFTFFAFKLATDRS